MLYLVFIRFSKLAGHVRQSILRVLSYRDTCESISRRGLENMREMPNVREHRLSAAVSCRAFVT